MIRARAAVAGGLAALVATAVAAPSQAQSVPAPPLERTGSPAGCPDGVASGGFTPNQLVEAYGIRTLHHRGIQGQGMRIALLVRNTFRRSDIEAFARCFGLPSPRLRVLAADPQSPPDSAAGEPPLDVEVAMTVAPRAAIDVYQIGQGTLDSFPRLFSAPLDPRRNGGHPPDVMERSYGGCELAWAQTSPDALAEMEHLLASATAGGVTVVASAGDRGSTDCQADGSTGPAVPELVTRYPASSRYVTGVGGTALMLDAANRIAQEPVWNTSPLGDVRGGGGGRSRIFPRPSWQTGPGVPDLRRSVPDVAFLAGEPVGYAFYCTDGCPAVGWQRNDGTSAGAPLMAAGVALVDQALRRAGRPRLGNANPLLYRIGREPRARRRAVFGDVLRGSNDVLGVGCCAAHRGYDLASGWGSLNFAAFAARAISVARG